MLEVRGVSVAYGKHEALHEVTLTVAKGETVVILGANGAGKTSLLNAIAGLTARRAGTVGLNGVALDALPAHRIVEAGLAIVPEGRRLFGELTVRENLQLGAFPRRARGGERDGMARVLALFPRLAERLGQKTRTMSGGEQQMVAIGRALMSRPEVLLLDEPSLGLSPLMTKELFDGLAEVGRAGTAILLVEQNARRSLAISRRGYVLERGRMVAEGGADALAADPAVAASYLGGQREERT
jgi:ABC-type branched-subunit amino acid transport system ATPase component